MHPMLVAAQLLGAARRWDAHIRASRRAVRLRRAQVALLERLRVAQRRQLQRRISRRVPGGVCGGERGRRHLGRAERVDTCQHVRAAGGRGGRRARPSCPSRLPDHPGRRPAVGGGARAHLLRCSSNVNRRGANETAAVAALSQFEWITGGLRKLPKSRILVLYRRVVAAKGDGGGGAARAGTRSSRRTTSPASPASTSGLAV